MSAALAIHNPDDVAAANPYYEAAQKLLGGHGIVAGQAAFKLFVYAYTQLRGRGGVLTHATRLELQHACGIEREQTLRTAIDRLCEAKLAHRIPRPERYGPISLGFLTVGPPDPQGQLFVEPETPTLCLDSSPQTEPCAPRERTAGAHDGSAPRERTTIALGGVRGGSARSELRAQAEKAKRAHSEAERALRLEAREKQAAERRELQAAKRLARFVTVDKVDVPAALNDPAALCALAEWLEYHRRIGKPYRDVRYVDKLLADFASGGSAAFVAAVNHSIGNCYQGLFSPRKGPPGAVNLNDAAARELYDNFRNA